jgi:hypothetical protein
MQFRASGSRRSLRATFLLLLFVFVATPAWANPIFTGGTGTITFGVTPHGLPIDNGPPTYTPNSIDGRATILTSPGVGTGGGNLSSNPTTPNDILSTGNVPLTATLTLNGGSNSIGAFGRGTIVNFGSQFGISLSDSSPGGTASYGLSYGTANSTNVGLAVPAGTTYGSSLAISGQLALVGSSEVAALRVHIDDTNKIFGENGTDLPQMVLAITRTGTGSTLANYNIVAIGGLSGTTASVIFDNGASGAFRALAVDNLPGPGIIPVGDRITTTSLLTAYADPASFSSFDPTNSTDLLALTGPLPTISFVGTTTTPEPASLIMLGVGALCVLGCSVWQWRKQTGQRNAQVA